MNNKELLNYTISVPPLTTFSHDLYQNAFDFLIPFSLSLSCLCFKVLSDLVQSALISFCDRDYFPTMPYSHSAPGNVVRGLRSLSVF